MNRPECDYCNKEIILTPVTFTISYNGDSIQTEFCDQKCLTNFLELK